MKIFFGKKLFSFHHYFMGLIRTGIWTFFNTAPVIFKHAHPFKLQHPKNSLLHNAFIHFRNTIFSVNKSYRNFFYFEIQVSMQQISFLSGKHILQNLFYQD